MRNIPIIEIGQRVSSARNPASSWCSRAHEREVLDLVAAGRSNTQIAAALHLSPKTVPNNVSSARTNLQVPDRAHATVRAAGLRR